jgi:hypothetical protein
MAGGDGIGGVSAVTGHDWLHGGRTRDRPLVALVKSGNGPVTCGLGSIKNLSCNSNPLQTL